MKNFPANSMLITLTTLFVIFASTKASLVEQKGQEPFRKLREIASAEEMKTFLEKTVVAAETAENELDAKDAIKYSLADECTKTSGSTSKFMICTILKSKEFTIYFKTPSGLNRLILNNLSDDDLHSAADADKIIYTEIKSYVKEFVNSIKKAGDLGDFSASAAKIIQECGNGSNDCRGAKYVSDPSGDSKGYILTTDNGENINIEIGSEANNLIPITFKSNFMEMVVNVDSQKSQFFKPVIYKNVNDIASHTASVKTFVDNEQPPLAAEEFNCELADKHFKPIFDEILKNNCKKCGFSTSQGCTNDGCIYAVTAPPNDAQVMKIECRFDAKVNSQINARPITMSVALQNAKVEQKGGANSSADFSQGFIYNEMFSMEDPLKAYAKDLAYKVAFLYSDFVTDEAMGIIEPVAL